MKSFHVFAAIAVFGAAVSAALGQQGVPAVPATPIQQAGGEAKSAKPQKPAPIYDEQADVKQLIADALVKAKKENRRVLIQWGGNWCGWCTRLHNLYKSDRDIAKKLLYEYDVVYADSGKPMGKNIELAKSYGAELEKHGFPYLTILDADGKALANQDTGSLEIPGAESMPYHDPKKVLDFLTKYQAEYKDAQQILEAGLSEASRTDKRVFLHFGAPWCGWCHKLEDWMAREDVNALLAKDFVDVKIDVDRTVGGNDVLAKYNTKKSGGIPWFVILDAQGNAIISSDGEKGNIGFPAQPEEIAHFKQMIEKSAQHMNADDIQKLAASLQPKQKSS